MDFSIRQLLVAAGKARKIPGRQIAKMLDTGEEYVSALEKKFPAIMPIIEEIEGFLETEETNLYTLLADVGQVIYNHSQRKLNVAHPLADESWRDLLL